MTTCVFCGAEGAHPFPPAPMRVHGWDWFTGYMDRTAHCCPVCRVDHHAWWVQLYDLAQAPPQPGERRRSLPALLAAVKARH